MDVTQSQEPTTKSSTDTYHIQGWIPMCLAALELSHTTIGVGKGRDRMARILAALREYS
jgi:hypothetical protein